MRSVILFQHLSAPLFLSCLLVANAYAQDTPGPETRQLEVWVGEWSYTLEGGEGSMTFERFGDHLIKAEERTPAGWEVVHFMRWDPDEEAYIWNRFWSSGYVDQAAGWMQDDSWVFLFLDPPGNVRRMTMTFESEDQIRFMWERSREGGGWETTGEGRTVRVR
jgi:hypothetical protein